MVYWAPGSIKKKPLSLFSFSSSSYNLKRPPPFVRISQRAIWNICHVSFDCSNPFSWLLYFYPASLACLRVCILSVYNVGHHQQGKTWWGSEGGRGGWGLGTLKEVLLMWKENSSGRIWWRGPISGPIKFPRVTFSGLKYFVSNWPPPYTLTNTQTCNATILHRWEAWVAPECRVTRILPACVPPPPFRWVESFAAIFLRKHENKSLSTRKNKRYINLNVIKESWKVSLERVVKQATTK